MNTVKGLRSICQPPEMTRFLSSKIIRHISIYFTMLFIKLRISANQTTVLSALFVFSSYAIFTLGAGETIMKPLVKVRFVIDPDFKLDIVRFF